MDPVSALGAAAASVQFLDFVAKLLSKSVSIYKSNADATPAHVDLAKVTDDLTMLNETVKNEVTTQVGEQHDDIQQLCRACNGVADELTAALGNFRKRDGTRWESFRIALRTVWNENEILSLQQRVDGYRQQISVRILVHIQHQLLTMSEDNKEKTDNIESDLRSLLRRQESGGDEWQSNLVQALHVLRPKSFRDAMKRELGFSEIGDREMSVPKAYHRTYEWIFNPREDATWSNFSDWFTGSEPLYWITGKPGAGKSTLMKFIYSHPKTRALLEQWGMEGWRNDVEVVSFSFFFWNSGTELQMSQEGLLRTILHQALTKFPKLADIVFESRLDAWTMGLAAAKGFSWADLVRAVNILIHELTKTKKVMFFLDGLDEFDGNHGKLVELIRGLLLPGVKACVSSRPWNVFQDAFFQRPSLRLEELTHNDISIYVTSNLSESPVFRDIESVYPNDAILLITSLTEKASGVFLWVFLATTSVLEGLSDGESVSNLQSRIDALPEDLEDLFMKILKSVDERHFQKAAQYFQIYTTARDNGVELDFLTLSFAETDEPEVAFLPAERMNKAQENLEAQLMRRRVNACTKGLLDTKNGINFLHRTVRDFVYSPRVSYLLINATGEEFDPKLRLAQAFTRRIKAMVPPSGDFEPNRRRFERDLAHFASCGIHFALCKELPCNGNELRFVREIISDAQAAFDEGKSIATGEYWPVVFDVLTVCSSFPELLVILQLHSSLEALFTSAADTITQGERSRMLDLALSDWVNTQSDPVVHLSICRNKPSKDIISLLLKYGANPDVKSDIAPKHTIWERALALYPATSENSEIGQLLKDWPRPKEKGKVSIPRFSKNSPERPARFSIKALFRKTEKVSSP